MPSHSTQGYSLRCSKLYNNNLSSGGGWLASSVAFSLSLSVGERASVFVTVLVLCTLADALKTRQTEYYTNTHLPLSSRTLSSLLSSLSGSRSPPLFLFPKPALERTAILARGCFVSGKREREREKGGRTAFERETNTPLRDFASSFDDSKMGKVSSFRWLSLIRIPATKVEPS